MNLYYAYGPNGEIAAQKLTRDVDLRAIKKAIVFGEDDLRRGRRNSIGLGVKCDVCGQEARAYRHNDAGRILACKRIYLGAADLVDETYRKLYWDDATVIPSRGKPVFYGYAFDDPLDCGRSIILHLSMQHCWFPEAA